MDTNRTTEALTCPTPPRTADQVLADLTAAIDAQLAAHHAAEAVAGKVDHD